MNVAGSAGLSGDTASYYDRIGGAAAVKEAVERFYAKVTGDAQLRPYFDSVDMAGLKRHQALLIGQVLGGPAAYTGRDLTAAHQGLRVTDQQFDKVADYLVSTLVELGVEKHIIDFAADAVLGLRDQIVETTAE